MSDGKDGRLAGKRAVITGGSQGLGLACAERFVAEGARVILADVLDEAGAAAAAKLGGDDVARFIHCDVTRRADLEAAIGAAVNAWGGIDVLINNAGIARKGNILEIDEDTLDTTLAVNLRAPVIGTQIAARSMCDQGTGGVIINMSSVNAVMTIPDLLAYNIAKGGMNQLTRNTAIALAPYGIRVCGIGPGTIMTELARKAVWSDAAARRAILSRTPMGRPGEPEEVASIAAFLASTDASYITGETIYVDGGRMGLNYTVPVPDDI